MTAIKTKEKRKWNDMEKRWKTFSCSPSHKIHSYAWEKFQNRRTAIFENF